MTETLVITATSGGFLASGTSPYASTDRSALVVPLIPSAPPSSDGEDDESTWKRMRETVEANYSKFIEP